MSLHQANLRDGGFVRLTHDDPYRAAREIAKQHRAATRANDTAEIARLDDLSALTGLHVLMGWDRREPHMRTAMLNPDRSRCADNHMRLPMLSEILTPVQAGIAGYGIRPWADAPTEEETWIALTDVRRDRDGRIGG